MAKRSPSATAIGCFRVTFSCTPSPGIDVRLTRSNGWLQASVRDDGRGFDVDKALDESRRGDHLGLLGMRDRVQSLGGSIEFESNPEVAFCYTSLYSFGYGKHVKHNYCCLSL